MALTKYKEGSVWELIAIAGPLMLSSFSTLALIFVDRVFLAYYNPDAMSAVVTSGTISWAILGSLLTLAMMAEVFVAQYNGSGQPHRIGRPVWQMIWFSLATIVVLVPMGLWAGELIFQDTPNKEYETSYFKWLTCFGWLWPLNGAISAFFIGRGKTRLVMGAALLANAVNILLDWVLIFGVEGWIPSLGVMGAAIGTNFGTLAQLLVFFPLFLSKKNRQEYGTTRWTIHLPELWRCLRVGTPQALLGFFEILGWAFFYLIIEMRGPDQIFVAGICQSVIILCFFVAEGIGRGAAVISGNFIGAQRHGETFKVFRSGLKIHLCFFALASIFFVIFPEPFIDLFTKGNFQSVISETSGQALAQMEMGWVEETTRVCLRLCLFYLLFEGVRWLISGVLTAAGDVAFLLIVGITTIPITLLLPNYLVMITSQLEVSWAFVVAVFFTFSVSTIFFVRFASRRWQQIRLISVEDTPPS